ncbi:MAG: acyl-CoA thioesterase [Burkholderiales bacterium]
MNLIFRLIVTLIRAACGPRMDLLAESRLPMRVWLNDVDLNWHMNNGRYLTLMDLGRVHLMGKAGVLKDALFNRHWAPVVTNVAIRYRRSLAPLQRFDLVTHVAGWDDKWFYLEQRFEIVDGDGAKKLAAAAFMRGSFRSAQGAVPTREVLRLAGKDNQIAPELSPALKAFAALELT